MTDTTIRLVSTDFLPDGREIRYFTITHSSGTKLEISDYGARITGIWMPDREGQLDNCVQRFDNSEDLFRVGSYYGATIGRYANRLADAAFELNGQLYTLPANENSNILHGGDGFHNRVWELETEEDGLVCSLTSPDMDQGFPGDMHVTVRFRLLEGNAVEITYRAEADQDTIINLTNHSYFSLGGTKQVDILEQELQVNADFYTPTDPALLPTGEIRPVQGTAFDFTCPRAIGSRIKDDDPDLKIGQGYDHNFVLRKSGRDELTEAATVYDPLSGRELVCFTTEPGMQVYTSNFAMPETVRWPFSHAKHSAICLETQGFPNSMKKTWFPSPILRAGSTHESRTLYRFSVRD